MNHRMMFVLPIVALLTTEFTGCGEESAPVAARVTPAPPPAPGSGPAIDNALLGTWYRTGYASGYVFDRGGNWYVLRVIDGRIAFDYADDGGALSTPRPGECIFAWTDYTVHASFPRSASYTYELSRNDSMLTLRAIAPGPDSVRVFVRAAVGDPVPTP